MPATDAPRPIVVGIDGSAAAIGATRWAAEVAPVVCPHTETVRTPPVGALVQESEDAYLVVLGTVGTGGLDHLVLGPTAIRVTAHAHCPVAVIRSSEVDSPLSRTGRRALTVTAVVDGSGEETGLRGDQGPVSVRSAAGTGRARERRCWTPQTFLSVHFGVDR